MVLVRVLLFQDLVWINFRCTSLLLEAITRFHAALLADDSFLMSFYSRSYLELSLNNPMYFLFRCRSSAWICDRVRNLNSPVPDTPSLFDENGMEFREHSRILGLGRTRGVPPRRGKATKMHPSRMTMLHVSGHPRLEVWRGRCDNTSFRGNRGQ